MTENYEYKIGGSLGENAPTYVVRQADSDLYYSLKAGDFCYIFNSRQMGKTSLIVRTMKKLQAEGFACTSLDFSVRGSRDVRSEQWYAGIVYKLVTNYNLANPSEFLLNWWRQRDDITPVQRLEEFIETVLLVSIPNKIIIFIDEIDSILSLEFATDDFFTLIRSCYEKRNFNREYQRLTFALVGVATPGDLIADRRRTPFNIGKAIQLYGFKQNEIEPLAKGFEGKIENPLALMQEVLAWTGGQPFLTQKVCKLLRNREIVNGEILEEIIRSQIIENWEAHDEPEHLKTIRDRILLGEQMAGRFLGWYQQILVSGYIPADESIEQMRFRLIGLVVKQQNKLEVYNKIYELVFNLNWVEQELNKLRPYSENFQAWVDSNYQDESRLLRGQALQDALRWANEKSLSNEDSRYLAASQELEKRELAAALVIKEEESRILAAANETLSQAQRKSKQRILFGSAFLAVSIIGGIVASMLAINAQKELQISQKATQLEQAGINLLREPFGLGEIDGLVEAMRAGRNLKTLVKDKQSLADYPAYTPIFSLQYILSNIRQVNQFKYKTSAVYFAFSPKNVLEINTISNGDSLYLPTFSADGKILASADVDNSIKLWNARTGEPLSTLIGHKEEIRKMAFSHNGKTLASVDFNNTIKLWDVSTGKPLSTLTRPQSGILSFSIAFSLDDKILASADADNTIKLLDVRTGKLISTLIGHQSAVFSVAFSSDRKTLASGSQNSTIKLWNVHTGQLLSTLTGHQDTVSSLAFSSNGKTLASGSYDKIIKLWDISSGKQFLTFRGQAPADRLAFSPDGKGLVSDDKNNTIKLWDISTRKPLSTALSYAKSTPSNLTKHLFGYSRIAFSPDGKTFASCTDDKTIKLWDFSTGKPLSTLTDHQVRVVHSLAFSADGKTLASGGIGQTITLWNVSTAKPISSFTVNQVAITSLAFSPDGKTLASGGQDESSDVKTRTSHSIKLWNVSTGKLISSLTGHQNYVNSVAFSSDGKTLASVDFNRTIKLWNVSTGKLTFSLTGHQDYVNSVAFSADGKTLASGSDDRTIKLWNVSTGQPISTLTGHQDGVTSAAFSPDGKVLASASQDKTIKLWKVSTGQVISTLTGHQGRVVSVVFSSDGKTLTSSSSDGTIKLWSLDLDDLLVQGCNWLKHYLANDDELRSELCPSQ
ncbi:AAA-like domain-containing protein [Desmonostoc muscorum LEGE 12446]|uniref:AAA-like domain-containing protein n=1 Tax=Desmonostoc muscorum LEGE 12446 TaxID=1828758 RepID=A0A8J6ZUH3_DESMC|nr:AAA-like domain-containing protein [Desmonostoc muscorum]MCF2144872.1 AAA-like domain-containing protein [Desmonostoc muscorum LEGE 12446]